MHAETEGYYTFSFARASRSGRTTRIRTTVRSSLPARSALTEPRLAKATVCMATVASSRGVTRSPRATTGRSSSRTCTWRMTWRRTSREPEHRRGAEQRGARADAVVGRRGRRAGDAVPEPGGRMDHGRPAARQQRASRPPVRDVPGEPGLDHDQQPGLPGACGHGQRQRDVQREPEQRIPLVRAHEHERAVPVRLL
ncbi:hypothetical protein ON010_g18648 [Phytophthora cinnamomi]|nr:hypothetical protein ON010_g18648 [Phytophthora cinnamomi]